MSRPGRLVAHLARRIRHEGPLPLPEVMALALTHREFGYYAHAEPFGSTGDFVTAPEVSQMFGELIGLWAAVVWQEMGAPASVALVELGPGRGTLMADALRAVRGVPGFLDAVALHLVEASPRLRAVQADTLSRSGPVRGAADWHETLASLPRMPTILIANEFFDALPIAQLVRRRDGWRERRVGLAEDGKTLGWVETPGPSVLASLLHPDQRRAAGIGTVAELCPQGLSVAHAIGRRLAEDRGVALVIDYGYAGPATGDTLQAVRGHRYADVLASLGAADLTAHVDFSALGRSASEGGAIVRGPVGQGAFLRALGIDARAEMLSRTASAEQRRSIAVAHHRLIAAEEMGTLFKAMAWTSPDLPVPPGL